jgi:hypothetical protein
MPVWIAAIGYTEDCLFYNLGTPLDKLPMTPTALSFYVAGVARDANAMLLAFIPLSTIIASIGPPKHAFTMFPAITELPFVAATIRPPHRAMWSHSVPSPLPGITSAIIPMVDPFTMHVVVVKFTFIPALVGPRESPKALLLSMLERALEDGTIGPSLLSLAILQVHGPFSRIHRPTLVMIHTMAVLHILEELANVPRSIWKCQCAFALSAFFVPLSFISGSTLQDHLATCARQQRRSGFGFTGRRLWHFRKMISFPTARVCPRATVIWGDLCAILGFQIGALATGLSHHLLEVLHTTTRRKRQVP